MHEPREVGREFGGQRLVGPKAPPGPGRQVFDQVKPAHVHSFRQATDVKERNTEQAERKPFFLFPSVH